jgi:hypothetical protein
MLNKNSTKQNSTDPYEYFIIDNFLDINTYTQMRKDFYSVIDNIPSWTEEYGIAYLTNEVLEKPILICGGTAETDSYTDICSKFENKKVFKIFLEKWLDKAFVSEVISPISTKRFKLWKPTEKINLFNKLFYNNLTLSIKLSRSIKDLLKKLSENYNLYSITNDRKHNHICCLAVKSDYVNS